MIQVYLQDICYSHVLYNTFGPLVYSFSGSFIHKIHTNNGTGKTMLLKTLLGMLRPSVGISLYKTQTFVGNAQNLSKSELLLSNSQSKKYSFIYHLTRSARLIVLDEPYSFLDLSSVMFYKKKLISHVNKGGISILTDCVKRTMLPSIIVYSSYKWL